MTEQHKKTNFRVIVIIIVLISACALFSVGFATGYSAGYSVGQSNNGGNSPTPTTKPTATVEPSISVTPSVEPTNGEENPYDGWVQYVLSDCQLKLMAPPDWTPGKRGEEGACGTFKIPESEAFENFNSFAGVYMVFSPMMLELDSKWGFVVEETADYLEGLNDDPERAHPSRDLRVGDIEDFAFAGDTFSKTSILRHTLGKAEHVFYDVFGNDYVIFWGGSAVDGHQANIDLILKSVEFLQPVEGK
ncbi:MAG: hypothetical protein ACE5DX_03470 [Candidatus Dojkabacteria bacterium]